MEDGQHTRQFKHLCNKLGSSYAPVQHVLWFSFAVVEGQPYYSSGQQISQGKRKTNLLSCIFLIKGLHLPSPFFLWCIVGVSVESSHSSTPVLVLPVRRLEHQHPPPPHPPCWGPLPRQSLLCLALLNTKVVGLCSATTRILWLITDLWCSRQTGDSHRLGKIIPGLIEKGTWR